VARYQVLYWQSVPSVVKAVDGDGTELKRQLPDWFQQEIDNRAMTQGLVGSDAYLEQWHWSDPEEREGSAAEVVDAVARELEAAHE
jgi:Virulence factor